MSTATVVPTMSIPANGHAVCPSKKKFFSNRTDAETFESKNREQYNLSRQYVYACEQCPGFHLSSLSPEANSIGANRTPHRLEDAANKNPAEVQRMRIKELFHQGLTYSKIAEKLGTNLGTVGTAVNIMQHAGELPFRFSVQQRERLSVAKPSLRKGAAPTLETISEEEKQLQAQLAAIQQKKQALIEAKRMKLLPCWEGKGVLISKEGSQFGIMLADVPELIEKLTEFITDPQ